MIDKLLASVSNSSDAALATQRKNAQVILDTSKDPARLARAEALLAAIEAELERRHLPGMIDTFLKVYPDGFYGERLAQEERNYKLKASQLCQQLLSEDDMTTLIEGQHWNELFERVKTLVNKTNLIQPSFEKPKLFDTIREPGNPHVFYPALLDCLHGPGSHAARIGRFADTLSSLGLAKWTYVSYFLYLHYPDECMFVKPEGLKQCINITQYPLDYNPAPSEALYAQILTFSSWLKHKLADLKPRDMIDVQSFMWHMAPTGIHAKDAQ